MSLVDPWGVAVDLGPRKAARPLGAKDAAALAAAFLHQAGVPEEIARKALRIGRATYYRHLNRAADWAVRTTDP